MPRSSPFQPVTPDISICLGARPLRAEIRGKKSALRNATLELKPVFPAGRFRTHGIKEERWKCVSEEETPVIRTNDDAASAKVALSRGSDDEAASVLRIDLPTPYVVEPRTEQLELVLKIGKRRVTSHALVCSDAPVTPPRAGCARAPFGVL